MLSEICRTHRRTYFLSCGDKGGQNVRSVPLKAGLVCGLQLAHELQSSVHKPLCRNMIYWSVIRLSSVHMGEGYRFLEATYTTQKKSEIK